MVKLNKISKEIERCLKADKDEFVNIYLDNEEVILDLLSTTDKIVSEIYLKENDRDLEQYLKFASIFSDYTFLNHTTSNINNSYVSYFTPPHKFLPESRDIVFPSEIANQLDLAPSNVLPCYLYRTNAENLKMFIKYRALIKNDKLFIRPLRAVSVRTSEERHNYYYVDPNTSNRVWKVNHIDVDQLIKIDNGLNYEKQTKLLDLTLPYFSNISIENLSKILEDESDLLSSFRVALKKGISSPVNDLKEYRGDVIRPEIEALSRKFKKIESRHKWTVGGSLTYFSLSLVAATYNNTWELSSLLMASSPGIGGVFHSKMAYTDSITQLKDNPYFLLWKISNAR